MITRSVCPSMKFKLEGVVVRHADPAQTVRVRRLPIDVTLLKRGNTSFTPFRLVINLKVNDPAHPGPVLLATSMEVQVEYTQDDLDQAKERGKELKLGYWNGSKWIPFDDPAYRFTLDPIMPPQTRALGHVWISYWDDPTKAWGT